MPMVGPELRQVGMGPNLGRETLENRALGISEGMSLKWARESHYKENEGVSIPNLEERGNECDFQSHEHNNDSLSLNFLLRKLDRVFTF